MKGSQLQLDKAFVITKRPRHQYPCILPFGATGDRYPHVAYPHVGTHMYESRCPAILLCKTHIGVRAPLGSKIIVSFVRETLDEAIVIEAPGIQEEKTSSIPLFFVFCFLRTEVRSVF